MYTELVHLLQGLKPAYILLIQACIVIAFPFLLWKVLRFEKIFPLGVVQIFSGVILGPSIFGLLDASLLNPAVAKFDAAKAMQACTNPDAKELFRALFGATCYNGQVVNRAAGIASVATIAVCLFGFIAGADADKELIRKSGKSVVSIGVIGMLFGWVLASVAGYIVYFSIPAAAGPNATAFSFSIAFGLVMAVSALPVLALILRGLDVTKRRIGAVALASASIADTMMWLGLGIVVALTLKGSLPVALAKAAAGGLLSVGFILYVASPILNRLIAKGAQEGAIITLAALSIFIASTITGITELHPVLGAFVAGFFLPDKVREIAAHRLDMVTTLVLMPFFFLNTGLNTNFSFFDANVWILFAISSFLCVFGKMVGHGMAARMSGEGWPFSMAVGLLLQTKGLMGIIVIVVFYDAGVMSPVMFAAAVFMCMFSTGLPTPLMRYLLGVYGDRVREGDKPTDGKPVEPIMEGIGPIVAQTPVPAGSRPVLATLEFAGGLGSAKLTSTRAAIGRDSASDVVINDIRVSRHHAKLQQIDGGKFEIHNETADRAEPNPITINGSEKESAVLADGDKVSIGGVELTFRYAK